MGRRMELGLLLILSVAGLAAGEKKAISQDTFDRLKRYSVLSGITYQKDCPKPPEGITIKKKFNNNANGIIFQDDEANELIVAFRGSSTIQDVATDADFLVQADYASPGVSGCDDCKIHAGFLKSWNAVAKDVISSVQGMLAENPGMKVVVTGHSLGGSLASLAAMSMIGSDIKAEAVTFGQPRTGNQAYADFVDNGVPGFMRVTHADDIVPQIPPKGLASSGYQHHSTEFWQRDRPEAASTFQCQGQEPQDCNLSTKSKLGPDINLIGNLSLGELFTGSASHGNYLGVSMGLFADGESCGGRPNLLQKFTQGFMNLIAPKKGGG
ncbi:hypothetical protein L249_8582 [Ophiocordyceps polyrhachis-furcata BCC 54312]|uniref:Fungal lipase-type domain-containing protein n=1 Tax=Ophiocordyceps polyrhachis-furcata BCC 54312 TaxID=1330021 RepID=A0A367L6A1_9HYPO|nr:hypothetical protein L249_8582 [Ophiocordyceps polyrhachis-furcata BCC 54312]